MSQLGPVIPRSDALLQAALSGDQFALGTIGAILAMGRMQARAVQNAAVAATPSVIVMPPAGDAPRIVNQADQPPSAPKPTPPPDKKDHGWVWKWAVPLGLMLLGPLCGLIIYGLGSFIAVPSYAAAAGCLTCGALFLPGLIWLSVVRKNEASKSRKDARRRGRKAV